MTLTHSDPTSTSAHAESHTGIGRNANTSASTDTSPGADTDAYAGPLYALFDCNSFYANCERLFRPDLRHRPIVVLSNNDGCVIARCSQARQWVKMGALYHQVRPLLKQHGVAVFSSNYALYANLSDRVMRTLQDHLPQVQVYSIDEAFAQLHPGDAPETLCRQAQQRVLQATGLPTGVGIGPTKTLAKLANYAAKRWAQQTGGLVYLRRPQQWQSLMQRTPVQEVWGIGSRLGQHLAALGIHTAADLAQADADFIRRRFNVTVQKTVLELRGTPCLDWDTQPTAREEIRSSRMFGRPQNSLPALQSALATYTEQACTRMRAQHSVCSFIRVSLTPREHHAPRQYYSCALPDTTDHTASILAVAQQALKHIWRPQHFYKKVSIYLGGLIPKDQANLDLFQAARYQAQEPLTRTIDQINQRWGRGTIHSGQASYKAPWSMRRRYLSPRYTTSIDEVWTVFCH